MERIRGELHSLLSLHILLSYKSGLSLSLWTVCVVFLLNVRHLLLLLLCCFFCVNQDRRYFLTVGGVVTGNIS